MAAMMQPQAFDPSLIMRPVASPQEAGERRGMWNQIVQKFQTDPNLQRAMFMTGAMMMQPLQPGQTSAGNLANAGVVGLNAYTSGTAADEAKQKAARGEQREERRLGMQETQTGAQVKATEAGTASTLLDIQKKTKTMQSDIDASIALAEEKVLKAKEFKDEASLRTAQRALKEHQARVELIPDEEARRREKLKYDKLEAEIGLLGAKSEEARRDPTTTRQPTAVAEQERILKERYESSDQLKTRFPGGWQDYAHSVTTKAATPTESWTNMLKSVGGDPALIPEDIRKRLLDDMRGEMGIKPTKPAPSLRAIDKLKKNPNLKPDFEALYGPGSADVYLAPAKQEQKPAESQTQRSGQQAPAAPAPNATPEEIRASEAEAAFEAARDRYQSIGIVERKRDPTAAQKAKEEYEAAKRRYEEAQEEYERSLGRVGAARHRTR
jgi:hypothetical protein